MSDVRMANLERRVRELAEKLDELSRDRADWAKKYQELSKKNEVTYESDHTKGSGMNDYERGWKAAIDEAEQVMVKCQLIPLMTPPDHPLFQLFFALKDSVVKLRDVLPTEADL